MQRLALQSKLFVLFGNGRILDYLEFVNIFVVLVVLHHRLQAAGEVIVMPPGLDH